ncbi:hypothetical protein GGS20DRAFT_584286 [Poronia punctata]|nr:hypothetical protein GGS20DRAFT_584286 [Poronia punctata]
MPAFPLTTIGNALLPYHQGKWNRWKLYFRVASIILSILLIAVSVDSSNRFYEFHVITNTNPEAYTKAWWGCLPVALIAIGLDGLELYFSAIWKRNPGMHPGWHIGVELIIWGGTIYSLVFCSLSIAYVPWNPIPDWVISSGIALVVILSLFFIIRFILFIFACVDTNDHNKTTQINMLMDALRKQNISTDPSSITAGSAPTYRQVMDLRNELLAKKPSVPPHELASTSRYTQELGDNNTPFYPEFEANQKFLVSDFPNRPYNR